MFNHYQLQIYFCDLLWYAVFNHTTVSDFYLFYLLFHFSFISNIILGISPNGDIYTLNQITFKYKMELQHNNIFMKTNSLPLINQIYLNKNSYTIIILMINEDNKWSLYLLTKNGKNLIMRKTVAGFWFYVPRYSQELASVR